MCACNRKKKANPARTTAAKAAARIAPTQPSKTKPKAPPPSNG